MLLKILFDSTDYALMILQVAIISCLRFMELNIDDVGILYLAPFAIVLFRAMLVTILGIIQVIISVYRGGVR